MARTTKKESALTPEEKLAQLLVPEGEQPYRVPKNWQWIHLLNSFDNHTDSKRKIQQKNYLEKGRLAIVDQGQEIVGGYSNDIEMRYTGPLPAIIFGDHTRCIKYVDFPFAQGADGVKVLVPKECFLPKAFFYALQSINIPNMGYRRHYPLFKDYFMPVPPLAEQQRIVDCIESLFAKLDEAKEKAQAVVDGFEDRKAAILHKAFTGELTKAQRKKRGVGLDSWESVTLKEIVSGFKYGTSEKSDYSFTGMPVLRIPNIGDDGIDFSDIKNLSSETVEVANQIYQNDILIIRSNGSRDLVGKCALVPQLDQEYAYASFLIRIKPSERVRAGYLVLFLNSTDARTQMFAKAKSSAGINNINSKELGAILLKLPELWEQEEISHQVSMLLLVEKQAKEAAEKVIDQIDEMKKSILARAFRGELGTNDPSDESAEELLKRVL